VRVAASGRFVVGIGREESGPVRLRVVRVDGVDALVEVPVSPRDWRIERVDGVPEATVNPPPAIAERIAREQAEVAAARTRDDAREDFADGFDWPVRGRVSGVYGSQRVYNGTPKSPHSGLDVAAPAGTPIRAPAAGVVSFARPDLYLTGGTVLLDHGHGLSSNFLHLSRLDVAVGQRVARGEVIGLVGATGRATGPHLHWGMNWFGVRIDPALLLPVSDPAAAAAAAPSR
jgi:murein DD-endopeptidase MepM/ murein hydrolase activator NlpD